MSDSIQHPVGQMEELSDLFIDACLCDENLNLIFMSVWGRDTAIYELLGRITLNASDPLSLRSFNLILDEQRIPVYLNVDLLEKRLTRGYKGTYFGSLVHVWLFDNRIAVPDLANHSTYLLENTVQAVSDISALSELELQKLWSQIVELAPFPLLDHWRERVMQEVVRHHMVRLMKPLLGQLTCWRIHLNADVIQNHISHMIRSGLLTAKSSPQAQLC